MLYGETFECPTDEDFVIPIGRAKIEREGADVTIVALFDYGREVFGGCGDFGRAGD